MAGCGVVHLFPRRKHSEHEVPQKGQAPVLVQRETISALFGRPQGEAAQELGLSVTTLKKLCRKLGVARWPYSRSSRKSKTPAKIDVQSIPHGIIIESDYSYESSADSFSRVASSAATVVETNVCFLNVPTEDSSPQRMFTHTVPDFQDSKLQALEPALDWRSDEAAFDWRFQALDSKLLSRPSIGGSSSFSSSVASSFASSASLCSVSASASFTVADSKFLGEAADEEGCDLGWLVSDTSDPYFKDVMWARAHHEYARFCRFITNV